MPIPSLACLVLLAALTHSGADSPPIVPAAASVAAPGPRFESPASSGWIANQGQWPSEVVFLATGPGIVGRAERGAIVLDRMTAQPGPSAGVRLSFEGARPGVLPEGREARPGAFNYFLGDDPSAWVAGARSYESVHYRELYPGIDVVLRDSPGQLKYDVLVAPGADLAQFVVHCSGADSLTLDTAGELLIDSALGPLRQSVGATWQVDAAGRRIPMQASYRLLGPNRFGLEVPDRDPALPLIIDPELAWATYLGSANAGNTGDTVRGIAFGANGEVTVVGRAEAISFPTTPGAYQHAAANSGLNVFVTRFRAGDGSVIFSSLIGGQAEDRARDVAVDALGRATVVGWTASDDFPTTPGAFDPIRDATAASGFVLRLSASGDSLQYSTFLESTPNGGIVHAVDVLDSGQAVVAGQAYPSNFPTTPGAFQTSPAPGSIYDGFVARLSASGASLEWCSLLGDGGHDLIYDLALAASGQVTVVGTSTSNNFPTTPGAHKTGSTGDEAFVTRFSADGASLVWSTLLGGTFTDDAYAVALDRSGAVIVAGTTRSLNFPTTAGAYQEQFDPTSPFGSSEAFITQVNSSGSDLIASTLLGGAGWDGISDLIVDPSGVVTAVGSTVGTTGFPTTPGAYDPIGGRAGEGFVSRLNPALSKLLYSTQVGGPGSDYLYAVAESPGRRVIAGGICFFGGFPTTSGSYSPDYAGDPSDGVVIALDLLLEGVESLGRSIQACGVPIAMNATELPLSGATSFGFYCSGAPPLASGRLIIGPANAATLLPVVADALGYVELDYSLAGQAPGSQLTARFLFVNTATCGGLGTFSASNELRITVQ